jgi:hypothetical protein
MTDMPEKIWMHSTQDYHHDSADEAEACEALENFQVYIREDEFFRLLAEERARPQREPACKDSIWVFDNTPEHVKDPEGRYGDWCARPVGKGAMEYVPRAELDEALEALWWALDFIEEHCTLSSDIPVLEAEEKANALERKYRKETRND